jgi:hypothetical protein
VILQVLMKIVKVVVVGGGGCGCVISTVRRTPLMYGRSLHQMRINVEWWIVS